jgi:quercetin dioxygenase-like cupin family protein
MDDATFKQDLDREGFKQTEVCWEPGRTTPEHAHPFDVRGLVLDGEITLKTAGQSTPYRAGQEFVMPAGCPHAEFIGPDGVRILVGRRDPG